MWFGILTPGEHPSRSEPSGLATLLSWQPEARCRVDGPVAAVEGGLRMLRDRHQREGLPMSRPRCFVCRAPIDVPDPDVVRADPEQPFERPATPAEVAEREAAYALRPLPPLDWMDGPSPAAPPGPALLALVHLDPSCTRQTAPWDEEALLCVPGTPVALLLPLDALHRGLDLLADTLDGEALPRCHRCRTVLPGSAPQRNRADRRAQVRRRRRAPR